MTGNKLFVLYKVHFFDASEGIAVSDIIAISDLQDQKISIESIRFYLVEKFKQHNPYSREPRVGTLLCVSQLNDIPPIDNILNFQTT